MSWKLANVYQAETPGRNRRACKPIEQIEQIQLTKEIVLKPQYHLFMLNVGRQNCFLVQEVAFTSFQVHTIGCRKMSGPHVSPLFGGCGCGCRTVN
jgi:hypothetical protein